MPNMSALQRQGTTGQTAAVISSRFKIFGPVVGVSKYTKLGVTSSFGINESKSVEPIRGLGYGDTVAELVPGVTQPMTLDIKRTALYLSGIQQMLGYKAGISGAVRSLRHHKWPFDIMTELVFSELANTYTQGTNDPALNDVEKVLASPINNEGGLNNYGNPGLYAISTVYEGCWMENYSTSYEVNDAMVTENCSVIVTDIFDNSGSYYGDFIDSGNSPSDVTGTSGIFGTSATT
jgi:hypothetical protein